MKYHRIKERGIVVVTITGREISTQKADSIARGLFTVPVRLHHVNVYIDSVERVYHADGYDHGAD